MKKPTKKPAKRPAAEPRTPKPAVGVSVVVCDGDIVAAVPMSRGDKIAKKVASQYRNTPKPAPAGLSNSEMLRWLREQRG